MTTECKASSSEEPGAGIPHAGICAGGARQRASLPRYVTEYVSTNGVTEAHYEYGPFGEIVVQSGDMADSFTHRFSTKPWCGVTGLSEYLFRKYEPVMGRWISRDPIGEMKCPLLYTFSDNTAIRKFDILGLQTDDSGGPLSPSDPDEWLEKIKEKIIKSVLDKLTDEALKQGKSDCIALKESSNPDMDFPGELKGMCLSCSTYRCAQQKSFVAFKKCVEALSGYCICDADLKKWAGKYDDTLLVPFE